MLLWLLYFSENVNDLSEKVYIITKLSLSSFFWHQLFWPCMNKHGPFQIVMSKIICAEWEFKGFTMGRVEKTCISISCVSFVMLLLLRLHILTWISESELGHINSIPLFLLLLLCMSLNCSFSFIHWGIIMCLVSNEHERRENALDKEANIFFQSCVAMKISHR